MKAQALRSRWALMVGDRRYLVGCGLVTIIYVIAAKWGLTLATSTKQVTVVWPPSAISLVVILLMGERYWPSIYVGALIANLLTQEPALLAIGIAGGDTLEALIAGYLIRRFVGFNLSLKRPL
jgi:integral membrane sensor domain MASE1